MLLQKTYTADLLSGTIKKNNGELPQYYIENNHTPIVSQEMFLLVQEEIARRKSKSPASQKKVRTNRGRYTSQYALSERLVCGECGCYYRRVTWNTVEKENCLAMHQPVGVRKEVLQVVTEHIGRCAAQCDFESNQGAVPATKGADSKMFTRYDTAMRCRRIGYIAYYVEKSTGAKKQGF